MVMNARQKQIEAVEMMLELNQAPPPAMGGAAPRGGQGGESSYKVLVIDQYTKDILAPLVHVNVLRQHGVTMHLMLESEREAIPGVPAVYFVRATPETVQRLLQDAQMGLCESPPYREHTPLPPVSGTSRYDTMHLNFAVALPRRMMEDLARGMVQANCLHRVARLYDQYLSFVAVESGLFTLGLPHAYTDVNNPDIHDDAQFAAAIKPVVDGLFCFLATMGAVPLIRCPPGGIAEAVATALERRVREALSSAGSNVFVDARRGGASIGAPQQVLLCLFDRDFDLSVMLEHAWMYKALVQDVLGMRLNKITIPQAGADAATQPGAAQRCFEVDDDDFFWRQNGGASFQEAAERVDDQLQKYKRVMDDVNQHTGVAGGALDDAVLARANQQLMSAVKSLPDLLAQKRILDKHMVLLHTLLAEIKGREIDSLHQLADNLLSGKAALEQVVQRVQHGRGNATDKLRVALIFLLVAPTLPSDDELRPLEEALQAAGADTAAFSHIRRNRRLNLTSAVKQGGGGSGGGFGGLTASQGNLLSFMDSTFGQGIAKITSNMKHMFAGARQAVLTMAVASLMEAKPGSEADTFLVKDPRSSSPDKAAAAAKGMFREAVVFMVGGGNYLECMRLHTWAAQSSPPRNIVYGTTELLSGAEFAAQLAELGRKCGA